MWSGSFRVYQLRLVLRNAGTAPAAFGNLCALFETTSDENDFQGMIQVRPPKQDKSGLFTGTVEELMNRFVVANAQTNDDDNDATWSIRGNMVQFTLGGRTGILDPTFGTLIPGERFVLHLSFKLGAMMKDEFLRYAVFLSPILSDPADPGAPVTAVVLRFGRPESGSLNDQPWKLEDSSLQPFGFDALSAVASNSKSPSFLRVAALNYLAVLHGQDAANVIRSRLDTVNEPRGDVRAAAMLTLGALGDRQAVPTLCSVVPDPGQPEGLRRCAAEALGKIGAKEGLTPLKGCVRDSKENVAKQAITAMGRIGGKEAVGALLELAKDEAFRHRTEAVAAMGSSGEPAADALIALAASNNSKVASAAVHGLTGMLKPDDLKQDGFDDEARETHARALRAGTPALSDKAAAAALAALETALRNGRSDVAAAAAHALGEVPGPGAGQILLRALEQKRGPAQDILKALQTRRDPDAAPLVAALLDRATPEDVCIEAVTTAVAMKVTDAEPRLLALAEAGTEKVRTAAINALRMLKSERARGLLAALLKDASQPQSVRQAALTAFKQMPPGADPAVILQIAGNPKDPLRWQCLEELCRLGTPEAGRVIQSALAETDEKDKWQRGSLKRQWEGAPRVATGASLADRLKSASAEVRSAAADEIKEKKDRAMLPALKEAVANEQDGPALWRLGYALKALECRDRDLVPPLIGRLASADENAVNAAAGLLRYISGVHNGPFSGGIKEEREADVAAWRDWWSRHEK
jgi:HEAT repeat protein